MTTCSEYYLGIIETNKTIAIQTLESDIRGLQSRNHNFLEDLSHWIEILKDRLEVSLLKTSGREYQQGLISVVNGQYRQAYNSLRFFVEHSLAAIHFSANELQLRLWMKGKQDIFWSNIIDHEQGIFSKRFVSAFCDPLTEDALGHGNIARGLYRECSEYTHGNYNTQDKLPGNLEFNQQIFNDWHDKAESAQLILTFALCSRYITGLSIESKSRIESSVMERLGHVSVIQGLLEI
ncbi:hypothetical protein ACFQZE_15995 [Paenibacillus sp. GCM10027627]|uniref:hypothetical protein n=1 Tax=unclassified Paenibacillus TaxID=185978 RepID=UPI003644FB67